MSYQVLARKWRPRSFETLVGQEHVVRALTHGLAQKRLHHAYLFTGTRGVGKTTIARILAKALNCETGITPVPCGTCSACTEIDAGRFVDLLEVDAATNTKVDEMRQLLENAVYLPTRGRFKVYVIDEVHMLSTSAFNAMLKTLEEPPEHIKFILATTDPQKIPVTVLSRCLQFNLKQMPASAIARHLEHILQAEGVAHEAGALDMLAQAAHGSMRDALSLLDQAIAFGAGALSESNTRAMLGTIDREYLFDILDALGKDDLKRILEIADSMDARSLSFETALEELARLLHRIAMAQAIPEGFAVDTPERERIRTIAVRFDPETVQLYYQIAILGRRDLPLAPDHYAGFTMTLMRMHAFLPEVDAAQAPAAIATDSGKRISSADPEARTAPASGLSSASWPDAVRGLKLSGFAKQLAERAELVRFEGQRLSLRIPPAAKQLAGYREKLRTALEEQWGQRLAVDIEIAEIAAANTVAGADAQREEAALAAARTAMESDPFVNDLISGFGATIESVQTKERAAAPFPDPRESS